ncbi:peptidyl-prolyl cis-trans isomerase [candidate division KSB1 bacterium]|nr:peptidyl-prolyl cis-trans isomerase [candidate division KSB1 bacterium]
MKKLLFLILLPLIIITFCTKEDKPDSPIVAKVGKEIFTMNDLKQVIPQNSDLDISPLQIQNYIKRWIENELVYQEALVNGFEKDSDIQKGIEKLIRDYIVVKYLEKNIDQGIEVTEAEIEEFYQNNSSEFIRPKDLYHIQLIAVTTYREANAIRSSLVSGQKFEDLAREHSLDESRENGGNLGWLTLDELPPILAEKVPYSGINIINRIKSLDGYYVIRVIEKRSKGETQTLEEVRDIITWRVKAWKRENKYRRLITYLSENSNVETNYNIIQEIYSDSISN